MKNLILIVVALLCFACDKKSDQDKLSDETIDAIAGRWHSARYAEDENFTVNVKSTSAEKECFAGNVVEFKKDGTFKEIRPCENEKQGVGNFRIGKRQPDNKNSIYIDLYDPNSSSIVSSPYICFSSTSSAVALYLYKHTDSTLIFYANRGGMSAFFYEFKRMQ